MAHEHITGATLYSTSKHVKDGCSSWDGLSEYDQAVWEEMALIKRELASGNSPQKLPAAPVGRPAGAFDQRIVQS